MKTHEVATRAPFIDEFRQLVAMALAGENVGSQLDDLLQQVKDMSDDDPDTALVSAAIAEQLFIVAVTRAAEGSPTWITLLRVATEHMNILVKRLETITGKQVAIEDSTLH